MPIPAIVAVIATALATTIASKSTETALQPAITKAKDALAKYLKLGKYEAIQRALKSAEIDLLSRSDSDFTRNSTAMVIDTLLVTQSGPLLDRFGHQVTQIYLAPAPNTSLSEALIQDYRKACGPVAILDNQVPDDAVLRDTLAHFFLLFREHLLKEQEFSYLREYFQLLEQRNQTDLQREMVSQLAAIAANTAQPIKNVSSVHFEYLNYIIAQYKDHVIRGFAPQVAGRVLSLPLKDIFLPLQSVEGRPALAEYAEEDLRRTAAETSEELDWMRRREEMEKRYAQLSATQAAQRPLSLAMLLENPRAVLLGDPGTGKTTVTRYIAYALAAGDTTHIGESVRNLVPILVRIANYGRAYEQNPTLNLVDYIEKGLTPKAEFGSYLSSVLSAGQCFVILDGLDEVTDPALRIRVTDRIMEMVALYAHNQFLVTSRIIGYEQSPLTRDYKHATLKELTQEDRERFIKLWYDAIHAEITESSHSEGANNLITALREKPQIARMGANPLLLTIMVLMHWRGVKLPNRRVQVYERERCRIPAHTRPKYSQASAKPLTNHQPAAEAQEYTG